MILQNHDEVDFEMIYVNSDGRPSSMCGNGGRCLVLFAQHRGIIQNECTFLAVDGLHHGRINSDGTIELEMNDVDHIEHLDSNCILDTGSPHYIRFLDDIQSLDLIKEAHSIRYNNRFKKEGINVNFVSATKHLLNVRTYERGVEDETYSCGTGVTAVAIAYADRKELEGEIELPIVTKGGNLIVKMTKTSEGYNNIWLCGPAECIFEGNVSIK